MRNAVTCPTWRAKKLRTRLMLSRVRPAMLCSSPSCLHNFLLHWLSCRGVVIFMVCAPFAIHCGRATSRATCPRPFRATANETIPRNFGICEHHGVLARFVAYPARVNLGAASRRAPGEWVTWSAWCLPLRSKIGVFSSSEETPFSTMRPC